MWNEMKEKVFARSPSSVVVIPVTIQAFPSPSTSTLLAPLTMWHKNYTTFSAEES